MVAPCHHKKYGDVFAYEVDGFGSSILMDDANYPSLLALPLMGFCDVSDPVYQNTRKMLLDKLGNPYYLKGVGFKGIGGKTALVTHTTRNNVTNSISRTSHWP